MVSAILVKLFAFTERGVDNLLQQLKNRIAYLHRSRQPLKLAGGRPMAMRHAILVS